VPELHIAEERTATSVVLKLAFNPPDDFDADDYPLRTTLRMFARFNGFTEARQLAVALLMKPVVPPPEPQLLEDPTFLRISTRQPVRLWIGDIDTHVRVRWNGRDDLVLGPSPSWRFAAHCLTPAHSSLPVTFSQPRKGRFSILLSPPVGAQVGDALAFQVVATASNGKTLTAVFDAVVAERPPKPKPEPRLIMGNVPSGASRRPPYELKYIEREKWENGTCWGASNWGPDDVAAYQEPTETRPLTLVINKDLAALEAYKKFLLGRKTAESEIKIKLQKYNSHVAFHLYQMYQASLEVPLSAPNEEPDEDSPKALKPREQRAEIHRVGMTLLRLMQVAR
jgi:hypothetical protein